MSNIIVSEIEVQDIAGELVVDSRLIAERLGIEHRSLIKSIDKYLTELQGFGQLRFQIATVTNTVGAINTVKFVYLNENQATLLMTLSKNTQQVVRCKVDLVKAFAKAKQLIKGVRVLPAFGEAANTMDFLRLAVSGLVSVGINPMLAEAHVLSQTARLHPDVAPQIEAAKLLVPQQSELQSTDILLNPTDIGNRMQPPLKPRQVNLLLIGLGLQVKSGVKNPAYELTDAGEKYGKVTLNQAANSDKTVQHIKWCSAVVHLLDRKMAVVI